MKEQSSSSFGDIIFIIYIHFLTHYVASIIITTFWKHIRRF